MANTYIQLYFHVVFAVRKSSNLISKDRQQINIKGGMAGTLQKQCCLPI